MLEQEKKIKLKDFLKSRLTFSIKKAINKKKAIFYKSSNSAILLFKK